MGDAQNFEDGAREAFRAEFIHLFFDGAGQVQTIPLAVTAFAGAYLKQWDLILTSALLAMIPIIVLFLFAQRYIIKGMVEGAIK